MWIFSLSVSPQEFSAILPIESILSLIHVFNFCWETVGYYVWRLGIGDRDVCLNPGPTDILPLTSVELGFHTVSTHSSATDFLGHTGQVI